MNIRKQEQGVAIQNELTKLNGELTRVNQVLEQNFDDITKAIVVLNFDGKQLIFDLKNREASFQAVIDDIKTNVESDISSLETVYDNLTCS